jgi:preprotein translocase subunit SecB
MTQETVAPTTPSMNLQRCYMKGLSVEMPHAPKIFLEQGQLQMDLNVTLAQQELDANIHEVVVRGTLTAKLGDRVVYLIEAEQAGIFELRDIPADQFSGVINVVCPNIIYPYLRALVADTISRTGLPVFHLPEVNWAAMFEQAAQAQQLAAAPVVGTVQ